MPSDTILALDITVAIDGSEIDGVTQVNVTSTNSYACDTFSVAVVVGEPPLTPLTFWANLQNGTIEITARAAGSEIAELLITGQIDALHMDLLRRVVMVEGRDLSAGLVDAYRQQDFVNQSASEIVTTIALQHGLSPVVTTTTGNIGRYYSDGFTRLSLGQYSKFRSDWDLIVQLGRQYGFDVFVQGQSLCFQPTAQLDTTPILLSANDVLSIRVERLLFLDTDTQASVQSWNSQDMTAYFSRSAQTSSVTEDLTSDQAYLFSDANLTSSQVDSAAEQLGTELKRLKTVLHFETPWNLNIAARSLILLTGTRSDLDNLYIVDSIEREHSVVRGSIQRIRAIIADQS